LQRPGHPRQRLGAVTTQGPPRRAGQPLSSQRLRDPRHRAGALDPYWITRGPEKVPAWLAEFERRRQKMLNDPAVLAALEVAGRKVEAPLAGDYWGGF
jgi:hypothetical protein